MRAFLGVEQRADQFARRTRLTTRTVFTLAPSSFAACFIVFPALNQDTTPECFCRRSSAVMPTRGGLGSRAGRTVFVRSRTGGGA